MENNFGYLDVDGSILKVLEDLNFKAPTSIQKRSIPYIFANKDLIITAATGSGKTLPYAIRLIQNTVKGEGLQGMVLVPTRELAKQVGDVLKSLNKHKKLNIMISYGGGSLKEQKTELANTDILVGTTGRISDYVEQELFQLGKIKTLVLDEADSIIQKQFLKELEYIMKTTPKRKQTIALSATISKDAHEFLKKMMYNPKRVSIQKEEMPKKLKHYFYEVEQDKKLSLLHHLLENERAGLTIVFTNRQDSAEFLSKNLKSLDLEIKVLHGDMGQGKRNKIIQDFENEKFDVLICTDLVARGLDIDNITHIYNYNIPKFTEKYIHRAGRTARAGASGKVISLISKKDVKSFIDIMTEFQIYLTKMDLPDFKEIEIKKEYKQKKARR